MKLCVVTSSLAAFIYSSLFLTIVGFVNYSLCYDGIHTAMNLVCYLNLSMSKNVANPRHACAVRVTVLHLSVCMSVGMYVCMYVSMSVTTSLVHLAAKSLKFGHR